MFLRFSPKHTMLDQFIENVVELPVIRRVGGRISDIYWAGEATVFEVVYAAGDQAKPQSDPGSAACMPVFRVHGLDDVLARLRSKGARVSQIEETAGGREAFFLDTDGFWWGLSERSARSTLPQDVEAVRRWRRGEAFNPGCKSMPQGIQEIGWVRRRVADVPAMAVFYRDVVGLRQIGKEGPHLLFDLGDNSILEVSPGGHRQERPGDHRNAPAVFLLRVSDVDLLQAALRGNGSHIYDRVAHHWIDLLYFSDPEGGVVAVSMDFHPGTYAPGKFVLPENLEGVRRWQEYVATQAADA